MNGKHQDVYIVNMDKELTHRTEADPNIYEIHFTLSQAVNTVWADILTDIHNDPNSNPLGIPRVGHYRKIHVTNRHIVFHAFLDEIPDILIDLKNEVIKANEEYQDDLRHQHDIESQRKAEEQEVRHRIEELASTLDF